MEIWKEIKDFEGLYEVSDEGNVRSFSRFVKHSKNHVKHVTGKILKQSISKKGYSVLNLSKNGNISLKRVSRLVAEAFISNPDNKPEVNHKDGNKQNNNVNNLEWSTASENIKHAYDNNLKEAWKGLKGETHGRSKLSESDVLNIRKSSKPDETLSKEFGVKKSSINKIRNNKSWKHL